MKEIRRKEVTFEIMEVRTVKTDKKEWIEIEVKVTDDNGERIRFVRVGDELKAEFEVEVNDAGKPVITGNSSKR